MNDRSNLRYGILGCGAHAYRSHYLPMRRTGGNTLIAVYDPDRASMERYAEEDPGMLMYANEDDFLGTPGMDAVVICSPDRFHASQLQKTVARGKHVLVDKPAASTVDELAVLDRALRTAARCGLVVSSCHPRRKNPAYTQLKKLIPIWNDDFGSLIGIELDFSYHEPSPARAGLHSGMLADHLNHEIDFVRFLIGPSTTRLHKLHDAYDRYEAAGMREDGIGLRFTGTRRLKEHVYPEYVFLRFERGDVRLDTATGALTVTSHGKSETRTIMGFETDYETTFDAIAADFTSAALTGSPSYLTANDILWNSEACVRLTEADSLGMFC